MFVPRRTGSPVSFPCCPLSGVRRSPAAVAFALSGNGPAPVPCQPGSHRLTCKVIVSQSPEMHGVEAIPLSRVPEQTKTAGEAPTWERRCLQVRHCCWNSADAGCKFFCVQSCPPQAVCKARISTFKCWLWVMASPTGESAAGRRTPGPWTTTSTAAPGLSTERALAELRRVPAKVLGSSGPVAWMSRPGPFGACGTAEVPLRNRRLWPLLPTEVSLTAVMRPSSSVVRRPQGA